MTQNFCNEKTTGYVFDSASLFIILIIIGCYTAAIFAALNKKNQTDPHGIAQVRRDYEDSQAPKEDKKLTFEREQQNRKLEAKEAMEAKHLIKILKLKLQRLRRGGQLSSYLKCHLEAHIQLLRLCKGDARREELFKVYQCCLPPGDELWKEVGKMQRPKVEVGAQTDVKKEWTQPKEAEADLRPLNRNKQIAEAENAKVMIKLLQAKLKELRASGKCTHAIKFHIEDHLVKLRKLRGRPRIEVMRKIRKCCLPSKAKSMKDRKSCNVGESETSNKEEESVKPILEEQPSCMENLSFFCEQRRKDPTQKGKGIQEEGERLNQPQIHFYMNQLSVYRENTQKLLDENRSLLFENSKLREEMKDYDKYLYLHNLTTLIE